VKIAMRGERFEDVEAIQRNVTRALKAIPEKEFSRSFQRLYERSKIFKEREGNYVENQIKTFFQTLFFFCKKN